MASIASHSTPITADAAAFSRGLKLARSESARSGLDLGAAPGAASVAKQLGPGAASARLASQSYMDRIRAERGGRR